MAMKKILVELIYDERDFDLSKVTPQYVFRVLKSKGIANDAHSPAVHVSEGGEVA